MPKQFSFKVKHCSQHLLLQVGEFLTENLNENKPVFDIYFVITKIFNKVWFEESPFKICRLNAPSGLKHSIHSYHVPAYKKTLNTLHLHVRYLSGKSSSMDAFELIFNNTPRTVLNYESKIAAILLFYKFSSRIFYHLTMRHSWIDDIKYLKKFFSKKYA